MSDEEIAVPFDELDRLLKPERLTWSSPEMISPTGDIAPTTRRMLQSEYRIDMPAVFREALYIVKELVKEVCYEKMFGAAPTRDALMPNVPVHAIYRTNIYLYKEVGRHKKRVSTKEDAVRILRLLLGLPFTKPLSLHQYSPKYGQRVVITYHEPDGWPKLWEVLR